MSLLGLEKKKPTQKVHHRDSLTVIGIYMDLMNFLNFSCQASAKGAEAQGEEEEGVEECI